MQRKHTFSLGTVAVVSSLAMAGGSATAVTITPNNSGTDLTNNILGPGINVNSVTYKGADGASGTFTNGKSSIGIDSGILLTSGQAKDAEGPNGNGDVDEVSGGFDENDELKRGASTENFFSGDSDLDTLIPQNSATQDATSLEIEFESAGGDVFFNYAFASEEYIDFEGTQFNDVFGFFLDGTNIAKIPGPSTPVSINTVNSVNNSSQFNQNIDPANFNLEYDGFTDVFQAQALDLEPGSHTIKLAIADTSDRILDSGVFLQANTFSDQPTEPPEDVPESSSLVGLLAVSLLGAGIGLTRKKA
ncbi:choice-of-anchor L domain-containing protein [Geitlerinema sp. PCC 9228]|uniref:choice-of-anchor L family PEP-CTERM protein n=1 Tax=Geitlerinema sp. PCC 9228 TaxID=111611 RepID=UPI0008F9B0CC|nr:choice-of-anchor L domain-containing protein [Geitlerinema sp. PCC 9228]